MSYYEYNDMFNKCQNNAPYKFYVYDIVDSKKIKDSHMIDKNIALINLVRRKLKLIEDNLGIKILYDKDDLIYDGNAIDGNMKEPIICGDAIGFTVYNKVVSDELIDKIFEESKMELGIIYDYHKANGCYETNVYADGNEKYFRGYCFAYLSNQHKVYKKKKNFEKDSL